MPKGRSKQWIVQQACNLRSVAIGIGEEKAIEDGRVFVDRKRCTDPQTRLKVGSCVDIYSPVQQQASNLIVLSQRQDLIAVLKPSGLSTIPDQRGTSASLLDKVARYVGEKDIRRVHATSRLDRQVSGVVVFALSRKARDTLRQARELGRYRRHYLALTKGFPIAARGTIDAKIGRGRRPTVRMVDGKGAIPATTRYELIERCGPYSMVAAEPQTGRTHQIRIHLAHVGAPILGDESYGGSRQWVLPSGSVVHPGRIALHAAWVEIGDEWGGTWRIDAPIPKKIEELWTQVGGHKQAWKRAIACLENASASTNPCERGRVDAPGQFPEDREI